MYRGSRNGLARTSVDARQRCSVTSQYTPPPPDVKLLTAFPPGYASTIARTVPELARGASSRVDGPLSERPAERLVPGLRRGDADDLFLAVAHVEVDVGEELDLRERIGRVDAQVRVDPGRVHARRAQHLDASTDAQTVGDAAVDV